MYINVGFASELVRWLLAKSANEMKYKFAARDPCQNCWHSCWTDDGSAKAIGQPPKYMEKKIYIAFVT